MKCDLQPLVSIVVVNNNNNSNNKQHPSSKCTSHSRLSSGNCDIYRYFYMYFFYSTQSSEQTE